MITNTEFVIPRSELDRIEDIPHIIGKKFGSRILRWFISHINEGVVTVEITQSEQEEYPFPNETVKEIYPGKNVVVSLIPTGIGCEIGGYAADAAPATALLASCCDYLITNPNAVNASNFISMPDNVWYTEGLMIDQFCKGALNLYKPYGNKVGLIIEKASQEELEVIYNVVNTARAVHGVDLEYCVVTEDLIGGRCVQNKSGSYVGALEDTKVLFDACDYLLAKGVNAIGVTSNIRDLPTDNYAKHFEGLHPNPVGGAEAIISHLIGAKYMVPCAHAPLTNIKEMDLKSNIVDARGAGEFASASGLACILVGLSQAPQVTPRFDYRIKEAANFHNLSALVTPASALGGIPALNAHRFGIPIIAVRNNGTILDVNAKDLGLENVWEVENYAEAAGILQAISQGISIQSIHRPLSTLRF